MKKISTKVIVKTPKAGALEGYCLRHGVSSVDYYGVVQKVIVKNLMRRGLSREFAEECARQEAREG